MTSHRVLHSGNDTSTCRPRPSFPATGPASGSGPSTLEGMGPLRPGSDGSRNGTVAGTVNRPPVPGSGAQSLDSA